MKLNFDENISKNANEILKESDKLICMQHDIINQVEELKYKVNNL